MDATTTAPVRLGRRAEAVYQALARQITEGVYPPGSRLPSEKELCHRFGASRSPVRKALERLAVENRVRSRQGSGTHVLDNQTQGELTNVIGLMYHDRLERLATIQAMAFAAGCTLSIYSQLQHHWDPAQEAFFLRQVAQQRYCGLLANCSPHQPFNRAELDAIERIGTRVVHTEPYALSPPEGCYVMPDYRRAGNMGAVALMLRNCDTLFFARMEDNVGVYEQLLQSGFLDALQDQGRLPDGTAAEEHILPINPGNRLSAQGQRRLELARAGGARRVGCVCTSVERAGVVKQILAAVGGAVAKGSLVVGVTLAGNDSGRAGGLGVEAISFDRDELYRRAVAAITAVEPTRTRTLIAPRLEAPGT